MGDLINRQDAIDAIEDENSKGHYSCFASYNDAQKFKQIVNNLPSARRTGKWVLWEDGWYCSACELYPPFDCDPEEKGIPYCPYCGADMRAKHDELL